ncbi:MAG: pectinesterase family protein, partial [Acidimicrobiales bacterium]
MWSRVVGGQRDRAQHFGWYRRILFVGGGLLLALVVGAQLARANTSVTLYVSTAGTVTTGCTSPGAGACETIQEGVNAAEAYSSSDVTVMVAAGTYDENVTIPYLGNDTLILQGAGPSTTTVDGGGSSTVFNVNSVVTIDDFTITDGNGTTSRDGGGVSLVYSVATLENDTFSNDTTSYTGGSSYGGGGVYAWGSTATLENYTFSNDSANAGGGIFNYNYGTIITDNDTFSNDTAGAGGGIWNYGTATLENDTFSNDT